MHQNPSNPDRFSERYNVIFNNAEMGIVIVNTKGEIIAVNPYLEKLFGYNAAEIIGNKIETLIPQRYRNNHDALREGYHRHPTNRPMGSGMKLFGVKKDTIEFPVEISLANYEIEGEKFVVGFINDVTKRKNDEDEIRKLNSALEEKVQVRTNELTTTLYQLENPKENLETYSAYQKAILDNAGVMLFMMNRKGVIVFFNPEATKLTGYEEEEAVNKLTPITFFSKEYFKQFKKELLEELKISGVSDFEVLKEKAYRNTFHEIECLFVNKESVEIPVLLTITSVIDKTGQVSGYLGVAVDISVRKKGEADLQAALAKEKKLNELKSKFVSLASHEFRTPLSTILSSAYLAEKYTITEDQFKREKHLNRIISSVNMLTDILNDFLSVGKIEEGKITLKLTDFNIALMIGSLVKDMQSTDKKNQTLEYLHRGNEMVHLDQSVISNIFLNLISNAIKFSPEGKTIWVETEVNQEEIILSVKDAGIGIPKEDQEHLMERFFRGSNVSNIQGTGLGLNIVSKYAERMNGKIEWTSEVEKGTTFKIIFKR